MPGKNISFPASLSGSVSRNNAIIVTVLIAALIADTMLSNISDIISPQMISVWGIAPFVLITIVIFGTGQYFLLGYAKRANNKLLNKKRDLHIIYQIVKVTQYVLIGILSLILLQIVFISQYYMALLIAASTISYTLGGVITGLLCYRFLSWYRSNKKNVQVLLYGLGAGMISGTLIGGILSQSSMLLWRGAFIIGPDSKVEFPMISPDQMGIMGIVLGISYLLGILALLLTWVASAIMLRYYSKKMGKVKYWSIISLPLASFLVGLIPIVATLPVTGTYFDPNLLGFRILSISALIGNGVLFGVAFIVIARSIRYQSVVVDYLKISGYGIALMYISLVANIAQGSFPPYGIAAYSFVAVAAYFFMSGIYSSAISVSADVKLRQLIKKSVITECKLIDSISTASMEQEIQKKVLRMAKAHSNSITEETGIQSSLIEDDMKEYLDEVLKEIKDVGVQPKEKELGTHKESEAN